MPRPPLDSLRYDNDTVAASLDALHRLHPAAHRTAMFAFQYLDSDPESASTKVRIAAEHVLKDVRRRRGMTTPPQAALHALLQGIVGDLPPAARFSTEVLAKWGNYGSHAQNNPATPDEAREALRALLTMVRWYVSEYAPEDSRVTTSPASPQPPPTSDAVATRRRIPRVLLLAPLAGVLFVGGVLLAAAAVSVAPRSGIAVPELPGRRHLSEPEALELLQAAQRAGCRESVDLDEVVQVAPTHVTARPASALTSTDRVCIKLEDGSAQCWNLKGDGDPLRMTGADIVARKTEVGVFRDGKAIAWWKGPLEADPGICRNMLCRGWGKRLPNTSTGATVTAYFSVLPTNVDHRMRKRLLTKCR